MPSKPKSTFVPKNDSQKEFARKADRRTYVLAVGPAGGGKTYAAVAYAVDMHRRKAASQIVICRPSVGAGESNGYLPGTLDEKLAPYMAPIYDCLFKAGGDTYRNASFVELITFEHMRGRTFDDAIIIVDEAQNATLSQLEMVMTRVGEDSKMFICGDMMQCDLPSGRSGLPTILQLLEGNEEFPVVHYRDSDNLRHPLVGELTRIFARHRASLEKA